MSDDDLYARRVLSLLWVVEKLEEANKHENPEIVILHGRGWKRYPAGEAGSALSRLFLAVGNAVIDGVDTDVLQSALEKLVHRDPDYFEWWTFITFPHMRPFFPTIRRILPFERPGFLREVPPLQDSEPEDG